MGRREIKRKFDEIVEFSGLGEFIDTPVKRYSSGMYARLGFSIAAHVEPDVLVVDEVLSVGDFFFQQKCMERMNAIIRSGATVIFVSHNLRAVSELCQRSLLLDHGRVLKEGKTGEVIGAYMAGALDRGAQGLVKDVYVEKVVVRNNEGPSVQFQSGERVLVDVDVRATKKTEKVAVVLYAKDEDFYIVFDTSTERLGLGNVTLDAGERYSCTFALDLHFARGTFHFAVTLYRYDIQKEFDTLFPAATVYVTYDKDVRGAVNVYPQVVRESITRV